MDKDLWDILIKAGLAFIAVATLFYKRTEILGLANKEYTAKLDSTVRFFDKFYKKENLNKLTLDRSAQELTRSDYVDYDLVVYLVELKQHRLINFDYLVRLYRHGRKFLIYKPHIKVDSSCFVLKIKEGRSVKRQTIYWNIKYVITAFLFFSPFIFLGEKTYKVVVENINIVSCFYIFAYFFGTAILAISSLVDSTDLRDANKFLKEIKDADERLTQIKENQTSEKLDQRIPNESWYYR